ncbi:MAG: hypothetical protein Q8N96_08680, partial [Methylovulum sp.]|nr:hypothetical protein [Methylovulum sp.]
RRRQALVANQVVCVEFCFFFIHPEMIRFLGWGCVTSVIYFMLSRRQPYCDPGVDYEAMSAKKNAPRWIKALKKIGKLPTAKTALA